MDGPARATHFSRTGPFTSSYTTVSAYVTARFFIRASMAVHHGPAYLFTTDSASVLSDGGDSWPDYIPWHPSHGFTGYALRLTRILRPAFGLGFPLQTDSPLHSPLSYPSLPDSFARDNPRTATHLSRRTQLIAFRHIRLVEVQIPDNILSSSLTNFFSEMRLVSITYNLWPCDSAYSRLTRSFKTCCSNVGSPPNHSIGT